MLNNLIAECSRQLEGEPFSPHTFLVLMCASCATCSLTGVMSWLTCLMCILYKYVCAKK